MCLITLIFLALLCSVKKGKRKRKKLEKPATVSVANRAGSDAIVRHMWGRCVKLEPHFLDPLHELGRAAEPPPVDARCRSKLHFSKGEVVVGIPREVRTKGMDCRCKQPLKRCNCCMCVFCVCVCVGCLVNKCRVVSLISGDWARCP